jgi:hypothetical protein
LYLFATRLLTFVLPKTLLCRIPAKVLCCSL